jgi:hypothetical protein
MDSLFLALFWSGPIGIGAFLAGLGVLFWGISRMRAAETAAKRRDAGEAPTSTARQPET